jgi:hypothetical protein
VIPSGFEPTTFQFVAQWRHPHPPGVVSWAVVRAPPETRHNTPISNILSTAPELSISQKALGTLPEDDNAMPKHVGTTILNKLNE